MQTKEFCEATLRYRWIGFLPAACAGHRSRAGAMVDYPLAHATATIGLFWLSPDRRPDDCGGVWGGGWFICGVLFAMGGGGRSGSATTTTGCEGAPYLRA